MTVISKELDEDPAETTSASQKKSSAKSMSTKQGSKDAESAQEAQKELLLCMRPYRTSKKRSKSSRGWSQKTWQLKEKEQGRSGWQEEETHQKGNRNVQR